ncbi:MAG: glycosyltransferase family 39 protein [Ignavibacteriales bacterium]|nr:glycosyltransferase family 39 protein [Ignavibacteriales bacterium]
MPRPLQSESPPSGQDQPAVLKRREEFLLGIALLLAAFAAAVRLYSADKYSFILYGDAASHLVKARQLIDSWQPGIENFGTVWLPIPHVVLLPFSVIDSLFSSGAAGPVVGIPLLIGTSLLLFAMVRRLTGSRPIALLSASIFGLNPNVVYLALTPMSELTFFFFITLGGYAIQRWLYGRDDRWLLLCSSAVMLATLTRYEAWVLAPSVALVATTEAVLSWKRKEHSRIHAMLWVAVLSLSGIVIWLFWNKLVYGDFLQFAPWKYRPPPSAANNPMWYRQEAVSLTLVRALLNIFGPVVLLACLGGIGVLRRVIREPKQYLLFVFLVLPSLFIFGGILTDNVLIDQWWWNWRFVIVFGLFASVAVGIALSELFKNVRSRIVRGVVVAALLAMPIIQLTVPSVSVATYEDAAKIFSGLTKYATAFGEKLGATYKGGSIILFTGTGLGERIMISSGIPLKNFHLVKFPGGQDIQAAVRSGDRYVVLGKVRLPDSRETVNYWIDRKELFLRYYDVVFEDENYVLLLRK